MPRNKFYLFLSVACLVGYIWIAYSLKTESVTKENDVNMCLVKHLTGFPCPSCGSTRSVMALMKGNIADSILLNPFGIILMAILVIAPLWILYDVLKQKATLLRFYRQAELLLKRKWIALPALTLVVANWVWNIYKGL